MPGYVRRGRSLAALGSFIRTQQVAKAVTAFAGGGKANGVPVTSGITIATVVATAGDSILLPSPKAGDVYWVINRGANACQLFAAGTATINGAATGTGISLPAADAVLLACVADGAYLGQIITA